MPVTSAPAPRPLAPTPSPTGSGLGTSPVLGAAIILFCLFLIVQIAIDVPDLRSAPALVDFDAFYVVGLLIHEGRLAEAYHLPTLVAAYREMSGLDSFMPWTYPPQFNLIAALLPTLPRGYAYLVFTGGSFLAYLWVLRRLAGPAATMVLALTLPILLVQLACGQNGFLTGALVGWMAIAVVERRPGAGVPLGLMAIKPHLGLALGLWALARGRWDIVGWAVAVGALGALAATVAFGPGVWLAFRSGVAEAAGFLAAGDYPLFRMTSLYAALHRLGVDPALAMAAQGALGLAAAGVVIWVARRDLAVRPALALACAATLMISPYTYDYDLTILGLALALLASDLLARARRVEVVGLMALFWAGGGWGLVRSLMNHGLDPAEVGIVQGTAPSIGAPLLFAALALAARILMRKAPDAA
jgi:hypothetical protein